MTRIESSVLSTIASFTVVNCLALALVHANFNPETVHDQQQLRGNDTQDGSTILNHHCFLYIFREIILPSRYTFTEKVFYNLKKINQESGARFGAIHMAGDEVSQQWWEESPVRIALVMNRTEFRLNQCNNNRIL